MSFKIWVIYGDDQPTKIVFSGEDVDDLKEAVKKKLKPELDNVAVSKIALRKHGELTILTSDTIVDGSFQNTAQTPLQVIVSTECRGLEDQHLQLMSTTTVAAKIKNHPFFRSFEGDLSFLEKLNYKERNDVKKTFQSYELPENLSDEVTKVQPWVGALYTNLANIWKLTINHETRHGRQEGQYYGDHYLVFPGYSEVCCSTSSVINYRRCWSFETKAGWNKTQLDKALAQCRQFASFFFEDDKNKHSKYISIITNATKYKLFYAYWDFREKGMVAGLTNDYEWSLDTLKIIARVFKTFVKIITLRANGTLQDFECSGSNGDFITIDQHTIQEAMHEMIVRWATELSSYGLPIVNTNIGKIEALQLLGTGWETLAFKACTTDNKYVVIKYCLDRDRLKYEAKTLMVLNKVKDIPRLLHEDYDCIVPHIVTSMVGEKVVKINKLAACSIMIDILNILKDLHRHGYIHNDIHPGNLVKVCSKFRLIDFGGAVPLFDKRDVLHDSWIKDYITFASHNRGAYVGAADDLESLCYTVAFLHNSGKYISAHYQCKTFYKKEEKMVHLFDDLPQAFQDFFNFAYDMDIKITPDYEYWELQFQQTINYLQQC